MADFTAEVLGIHVDIVRGLGEIWSMLRATIRLPPDYFRSVARKFRNLYYREIPWAVMPPTIHKVVDHGHMYFERVPPTMALGMFTEENGEAVNKILRKDEIHHARQCGRKERATDVFQRKLDESDPVILAPQVAKHHHHQSEAYPKVILDAFSPMETE